jgi:hypothetical protein
VDGCYAGLVTSQRGSQIHTDSIVGNTVTVPASGRVGIGVTGIVTAHVTRNTVTGAATGRQSYGLIDVSSCPTYGNCPDSNIPTVVIDSNHVTGGTVWGIHAEYVDSLRIEGNRVENLNLASAVYGVDYSADGAIAVLYTLRNFARIARNVIRHIASNGIVIAHDGIDVSVDSNVVADVDSSGLTFRPNYGNAAITRNLFTGARGEGLRINEYYGFASVTDNNIAGNPGYGLRVTYVPAENRVDATNNWWGDLRGPACQGVETCDPTSNGDSLDYYSVNWRPFRSAPNDAVPPLPVEGAPRFMADVRAVPPVRSTVSTNPLDAPIRNGERLHMPKARPAQPVSGSPSASRAPATQTGPAAERRAAEERDRAAVEAHRAERLQQLRVRATARLQAEAENRARRESRAPRSQ